MFRFSLKVWIAIAGVAGVLGGLGTFTFLYAHGFSYLSADPAACRNCHIMQEQYDSWRKASHHAAATCVECHLPHGFLGKWLAKVSNGWHHSKAFTLQNFHEPIQITPGNSEILQANCVRCHGEMVEAVLSFGRTEPDKTLCVHCHDNVGHGPRR
jgi:cytochrome c nitrite reductase small subunit